MKSVAVSKGPLVAHQTRFHRGESAKDVRKDDVFDLIEENFDRFDRDGNARITWSEMRKSVADPTIQGEDAASLATLYSLAGDYAQEQDFKRIPSITRSFIDELRSEREFQEEEGDTLYADVYYSKYLGKLENASTELFGSKLPDGMKVRQGVGPSCAILSTTVGQALVDPQVIKDAFSVRDDGKVAIKFPGLNKPVVVSATTDTETALFASAGKNGTWLNHVEKAWGTLQTKNPEAAFEFSSWPAKSIRAWSDGKAITTKVPQDLSGTKKGETPTFVTEMAKELSNNHIVMTWTRNGERELTLVSGHAHTVLGIDQESETIKVRNPWGRFEPTDSKGKPRDGKDDGIFELSYAEYVQDFGKISMQTTQGKKQKSA